ncbi:T3SS effector HopA1 family protein [Streptomyces sp. ME19-01-6]|uniref:T3SS effector HopA1 family protein n=1 Tax=Streptomyces sp. ME19-01-6 TaxID=3028686 RepID=UPI0029A7A398|nr:T3SS effector HopA1 family protein [Streptomyces sp. ME19-01-6]MDX3228062.1 T3SS effector HopA1 family protein [Streptomyces sp. ME19-01-6]
MTDTSGRTGPGPLSPALRAALTHLRLRGLRPDSAPEVWLEERRIPGDTAREVRLALTTALYERWHAGMAPEPDAPARLPRRDHAFEARLVAATPHSHTAVEAVVHTAAPPGGGPLTVELGRVRVGLPPEAVPGRREVSPPGRRPGDHDTAEDRPRRGRFGRHAADAGWRATPATRPGPPAGAGREYLPAVTGGAVADVAGARVVVELPAVRPTLSPGFLLVDGVDGRPADRADRELLRIYVHLRYPDAAPRVWGALLAELGARSVPYRAKVLSRPCAYPRRDAIVVYLDADRADVVFPLAAAVRRLPGIGADTSVFARRLLPGIALAWEPRDPRPGWRGQSFGQHRAAAVAEGVVRHMADRERTDLAREIAASLHSAAADPAEPARNHSSPGLPAAALLTLRSASCPS